MIGTVIYLGGGVLSYKVMFLVLVFHEPYTLKYIPAISFMQYQYIISEPEITFQSCPGRVPEKILKCLDILKYVQALLKCMQIYTI